MCIPLSQLLVKSWAKRRALIDPTAGRLNSFSWSLLVTFFLQLCRPVLLAVTSDSPAGADGSMESWNLEDAAFWSWLREDAVTVTKGKEASASSRSFKHSGARAACSHASLELELASLLQQFFAFWRDFDLQQVASVRSARCIAIEDSALIDAARARVVSPDGRNFIQGSTTCLLLEDPIEPDENVARTLAETYEWRAELARAAALTERSEAWDTICSDPAKYKPELRPYLLAGLPSELRELLEAFVQGRGTGKIALPPMDGGQRLSMHQLANGLNLVSKSVGTGSSRHVVWYRTGSNGPSTAPAPVAAASQNKLAHEQSGGCDGDDGCRGEHVGNEAPSQQAATSARNT